MLCLSNLLVGLLCEGFAALPQPPSQNYLHTPCTLNTFSEFLKRLSSFGRAIPSSWNFKDYMQLSSQQLVLWVKIGFLGYGEAF